MLKLYGSHRFTSEIESRIQENGKEIGSDLIIQILNHFNFFGRPVTLNFVSKISGISKTCHAIPKACVNARIFFEWQNPPHPEFLSDACLLGSIQFNYKDRLIFIKPDLKRITKEEIEVILPGHSIELNTRKAVRYRGQSIDVSVDIKNHCLRGKLCDYSAFSFGIEISDFKDGESLLGDLSGQVFNIKIENADETIYSGMCDLLRYCVQNNKLFMVLSPKNKNIPTLQPKKYRSERIKLVPNPSLYFAHPITRHKITLDVKDLSASGFSVQEKADKATLLPGMLISEAKLRFATIYEIPCRIKIIYRHHDSATQLVVYGVVFIEMSMEDHTKLLVCLQQAHDQCAVACHPVDLDELWHFFFESGFIYPRKYSVLSQDQNPIRKTIERLYTKNTSISRHFFYQEDNQIKGHIALLRVFDQTWMMHHLAAIKGTELAGLKVLRQGSSFLSDSCYLPANKMKYAIAYYRPENKFPCKVFGGVTRSVKNPKICSTDVFAYYHTDTDSDAKNDKSDAYDLTEANSADLLELGQIYETLSGGLMLKALDIGLNHCDQELSEQYRANGFKRLRNLLCLRTNGRPAAIFMLQVTDAGTNFSNLTNCIHIFIIDLESDLSIPIGQVLSKLSKQFGQKHVPVNLFPYSYAEKNGIAYEKKYVLWILEMQYSDFYYNYLERLTRHIKPL